MKFETFLGGRKIFYRQISVSTSTADKKEQISTAFSSLLLISYHRCQRGPWLPELYRERSLCGPAVNTASRNDGLRRAKGLSLEGESCSHIIAYYASIRPNASNGNTRSTGLASYLLLAATCHQRVTWLTRNLRNGPLRLFYPRVISSKRDGKTLENLCCRVYAGD